MSKQKRKTFMVSILSLSLLTVMAVLQLPLPWGASKRPFPTPLHC